jgi:D-3-phosphoglycerate dehydrogenase / 2-oxoglutarate reductase
LIGPLAKAGGSVRPRPSRCQEAWPTPAGARAAARLDGVAAAAVASWPGCPTTGPLTSRILVIDQNFGDDAALERRLVVAAGGSLALEHCRDEDDVAVALARHRPDAALVQFAPVGRRALADPGPLRALVRYGVGVDNIDTAVAAAAGIRVARVPDYCVDEVADHTLALLLAVERGIVALASQTVAGGWDFRAAGRVRRLRGRTLGLVGFGRIACAVGARAGALGMRLVAHDPALGDGDVRAAGATPAALDELLRAADVLSLHVPLTDDTRALIGAGELALLPVGAVVLNTARGGLVDEAALAAALADGRLGGAGLDVLAGEPPPPDHPLRRAPNVVLTPHTAWYSEAAVGDLRRKAVEAALALLDGAHPPGEVAA